jgi:hypothetical protein
MAERFDRGPKKPAGPRNPDEAVFGFVLTAFDRFAPMGNAIDEESVIRIMLAGRCPSREMALQVIHRMVQDQILEEVTPSGKKAYRVVKQVH